MDFALLIATKAATRNATKYAKLASASVFGAAFAVVFPLLGTVGYFGISIKLCSGIVLCLIAGKFEGVKGFIKFTLTFAALTFLSGGALIAVFSLAGVDYAEGGGYILSSVPIGIPLLFVAGLIIAVKKAASRIAARSTAEVTCRIYSKGKKAVCRGFFDSGNKVKSGGAPVSIVPQYIAKKLTGGARIKSFVDIHTVSGGGKIPVFTVERLEIDDGEKTLTLRDVELGISPQRIYLAVLHPDLAEES